jgi:hypothetical protein
MIMQMESPVHVLQQRLAGQRPTDGTVLSAAQILADRLSRLKALSPMFEAVSFSPDAASFLAEEPVGVN